MFKRLLTRAKVATGLLVSYTSFEAYMYLRTQQVIQTRQQTSQISESEGDDIAKYRSATVNGMFVNPFEEYRPQTGFEFLFVRVMEVVESFYGNKIEVHDKYPTPEGGFESVDDLLKTFRPNYELMRSNLTILQSCVSSGNFSKLYASSVPLNDQLLFTWLGQSCSLVQVSGINILTDPIFSDHLFTKAVGPRRLVKSPMSVDDVKYATNDKLHFIFVSHNHPDHLELDAAKEIGNSATWIVPLGLKLTLARKGIYNVIEMDWWDTVPLNKYISDALPEKYEVVCVPAMHWSGRHVVDSNTSLWGLFILRKNGESILYHAGDTGFSRGLFEVIGKRYGPVALLVLPIGQYCPLWHQKPRHTSPAESLEIARLTGSLFVQGVHFGTFKLSSEPILEPKNKLLELADELGKTGVYLVPDFGLTYLYHLHDGLHHRHTSTGETSKWYSLWK